MIRLVPKPIKLNGCALQYGNEDVKGVEYKYDCKESVYCDALPALMRADSQQEKPDNELYLHRHYHVEDLREIFEE